MIHEGTDYKRTTKSGHRYWAIEISCDECKVGYTMQRSFALNKTRHRCQRCGKNFSGKKSGKLDVHHIDCNKYNNEEGNLISLCKSCHAKTHWDLR